MAHYIRKENLGSDSDIRRRRGVMRRIELSPEFKAAQRQYSQVIAARQGEMKDELKNHAEAQRWRTLTAEEKARDAIERMVPTTKQLNEIRSGKECSYEDARKEAEKIAYKHDKNKEK